MTKLKNQSQVHNYLTCDSCFTKLGLVLREKMIFRTYCMIPVCCPKFVVGVEKEAHMLFIVYYINILPLLANCQSTKSVLSTTVNVKIQSHKTTQLIMFQQNTHEPRKQSSFTHFSISHMCV